MFSGTGGRQSGTSYARSNCSQAWRSFPFTWEAGTINWPLPLRTTTLSATVPPTPPAPMLGGVAQTSVRLTRIRGIFLLRRNKVIEIDQVTPDGLRDIRVLQPFRPTLPPGMQKRATLIRPAALNGFAGLPKLRIAREKIMVVDYALLVSGPQPIPQPVELATWKTSLLEPPDTLQQPLGLGNGIGTGIQSSAGPARADGEAGPAELFDRTAEHGNGLERQEIHRPTPIAVVAQQLLGALLGGLEQVFGQPLQVIDGRMGIGQDHAG